MAKKLFEDTMVSLIKKTDPEAFLEAYMVAKSTPAQDNKVIELFLREDTYLKEDQLSDKVAKKLTDEASGVTRGMASNEGQAKKKARAIIKLLKTALSLKSDDMANSTFRHKALRIAIGAFLILGSAFIPASLIVSLTALILTGSGVTVYSLSRAKKEIGVVESQINYIEDKLETVEDSKKRYELNKLKSDLEAQLTKAQKNMERNEKIKEKSSQYAEYKKDKHLENSAERKNRRSEAKSHKHALKLDKISQKAESKREKREYRKQKSRSKSNRNNEYGVGF